MRLLIGIDDTDNLESRGTGFCARQLGQTLVEQCGVTLDAVTRHQLLVDPRIPYTSHNSSACLALQAEGRQIPLLFETSRHFLLQHAAVGSDVGLCLAQWEQVTPTVIAFGNQAKEAVVTKADAIAVAQRAQLHLAELTGTGGGIIGALAGVGLHVGGNDGRFLWLPSLRELSGVYALHTLLTTTGIDRLETEEGECILDPHATVDVGTWSRPILRQGQACLLVEKADDNSCNWRVIAKERVKHYSE